MYYFPCESEFLNNWSARSTVISDTNRVDPGSTSIRVTGVSEDRRGEVSMRLRIYFPEHPVGCVNGGRAGGVASWCAWAASVSTLPDVVVRVSAVWLPVSKSRRAGHRRFRTPCRRRSPDQIACGTVRRESVARLSHSLYLSECLSVASGLRARAAAAAEQDEKRKEGDRIGQDRLFERRVFRDLRAGLIDRAINLVSRAQKIDGARNLYLYVKPVSFRLFHFAPTLIRDNLTVVAQRRS